MKIAVKRAATEIDEAGNVAGHEAGDTLTRRFLRIFPGAQIIGPERRAGNGFEVVPLSQIDPRDTVIVNFDVYDSPTIWNDLYLSTGHQPKVMNFLWWPLSQLETPAQQATTALSCGLFPTFANSRRTAGEITELVRRLTVQPIYEQMTLGWVNLGFRLDHVQQRRDTEVPIVEYPAIYLNSLKRPELFMEILERVHQRTPVQVEMRLEESNLVSEKAMRFSRLPWVWVGPLTSSRTSYWEALSRTTALLATASEESYGLAYVEALGAGVVGVFPNLDWARAILPPEYPFLYQSKVEAEEMLYRAVTDPDGCRAEMDRAVGGSFVEWISQHHSDATFDREVQDFVAQTFAD